MKAQLFDKRKYVLYFATVPIQIAIGTAVYQFINSYFFEMNQNILQDVSNVFFVICITTGIQYFKRGVVNQFQLQELRVKNAEMELNSLKAQINPHFLFNNLNNVYAMNILDPKKGSEMIIELAEIMRYHLEFAQQAKISLEEEIQLINSYIALEKLRLNQQCEISLEIPNSIPNQKIAPLLLIPFIENAFKHGTHPQKECFVSIIIKVANKRLHFEIENSKMFEKKIVKTNIGLRNTKKRLELIYPKKHALEIIDDNTYTVKLSVEL